MCLNSLNKKAKRYMKKEKGQLVGWKIFEIFHHQLNFYFLWQRARTERWLTDTNIKILHTVFQQQPYQTGYHIYLKESDAKKRSKDPRKVYYKNPTSWGYQDRCPIVVARKLFIPSLRKRRI